MDSNMLVVFGWKNERFEDTKEVIVNRNQRTTDDWLIEQEP